MSTAELLQLIAENPRDPRTCHQASAAHLDGGDLQKALNTALKAVDLGLQAKRPNIWHIRHCARVLIDTNMPSLALDLLDRHKREDPKHLMALQRARALHALRRAPEALRVLEAAEKISGEATYRRQLTSYRKGLLAG